MYAAENGHAAVVQLRLDKGTDIESKGNGGETPPWWAAGKGHEAIVRLLLEKGADTETRPILFAATVMHL